MATIFGTNGNNSWTVVDPGTLTLDGLGGTDTVDFGTSLRSAYTITQDADGSINVDSVSSASGVLRAKLVNIEILQFDSKRDTVNLSEFFGDTIAPTVSITDNVAGTARNSVIFSLQFSETVTGLNFDDFTVSNGNVLVVAGNGRNYSITVQPAANLEGLITLSLKAGAVVDGNNNPLAGPITATQAIDTLGPTLASSSPSAQSSGVASSAPLTLNFSEDIRKANGLVVLKDVSGAVVSSWDMARAGEGSVSGKTLTLVPSNPLPAGKGLVLEIPTGALTDALGNNFVSAGFAASPVFSFVTAPDASGSITGTALADVINAGTGRKSINGAAGLDTVVASGDRAAYTLAKVATGYTLRNGDASTQVDLQAVERLQFGDTKLALDVAVDGRAGQVALLLGAVFGRESVANATFVGIGLNLLDGGMGFDSLMQVALNFKLGAGFSNSQVVDLLYTNVVGAAPAPDQKANFVGLLDTGAFTPASLGVLAATIELNQANVGLVGLADTGLLYV